MAVLELRSVKPLTLNYQEAYANSRSQVLASVDLQFDFIARNDIRQRGPFPPFLYKFLVGMIVEIAQSSFVKMALMFPQLVNCVKGSFTEM